MGQRKNGKPSGASAGRAFKVLKVLSCLQLVSRKEMTCCNLNQKPTFATQRAWNSQGSPRVSDLKGLIRPKNLRFELICLAMVADGYELYPQILDVWLCCRLFTAACPRVIKSSLSSGINYNMLRQRENTRSSTSHHQPRRRLVGVKINARSQH